MKPQIKKYLDRTYNNIYATACHPEQREGSRCGIKPIEILRSAWNDMPHSNFLVNHVNPVKKGNSYGK
jgi:hypothetical protein